MNPIDRALLSPYATDELDLFEEDMSGILDDPRDSDDDLEGDDDDEGQDFTDFEEED